MARMIKFKLLFALCLIASMVTSGAVDYSLPADNQGWWAAGTEVGVPGGIDQYRAGGASQRGSSGGGTTLDVTQSPYNADNTGTSSARVAIQNAVNAAGEGDLVYLPSGTYLVDGTIWVASNDKNFTIRGAGPDNTTLYGSTNGGIMIAMNGGGAPSTTQRQTLTGTKTKGTSTITVADSSGYSVGALATVFIENEEDNTRIQAGAPPMWSGYGNLNLRQVVVKVTAVPSATQITIDPPLIADCTPYDTFIETGSLANNIVGVGVEDLSMEFDVDAHPARGISIARGVGCWIYNVDCPDWRRAATSGSAFYFDYSYQCELRKCSGRTLLPDSYGDDGLILLQNTSSSLFVNNYVTGYDNGIYNSGKTYNNVFAFNYLDAGKSISFSHKPHPSLDLYEGNISNFAQADGYHGSTSHNTIYRNWFMQRGSVPISLALGRFTRNYALVGNVFGEDGVVAALNSYGNPNIGNSGFTGTAQPTLGDFWADWKMTGTLTTRTSDTAGVITMSGGDWSATSAANIRYLGLHWGGYAFFRAGMQTAPIDGSLVVTTVSAGGGDILPAQGTVFDAVFNFGYGYQERDLDAEASTIKVHNYEASLSTGAITDSTVDTLPDSLCYAAQPSWWGDDSFAGSWPPINPNSPSFSVSAIPAGARQLAATGVASAPAFSPAGGTYGSAQNVTITSASDAAVIYYTTDGSTPDDTDSIFDPLFPIAVSATTTIKAFATSDGLDDSSVSSATYTIDTVAAAPALTPAGGSFTGPQSVSITTSTAAASIYYTTDGSTPDNTDTLYSGPISVDASQTLKAIAIKGGLTDSPVTSEIYTIEDLTLPGVQATITDLTTDGININE